MKLSSRLSLAASALSLLGVVPASAQLYFDTNADVAGTGQTAGSFTWDTGTNWTTDSAGTIPTTTWVDGSNVVFSATGEGAVAYTITIGTGVTVQTNSITFNQAINSTHTITGGTIAAGASPLVIDASAAGTVAGRNKTIASALTGTGGLTLAANGDTSDTGGGSGTIFALTGANTISGGVTITSGVVGLSSNFGDASNAITLNGGGILDNNLNLTNTRNIKVGAAGGVIRLYGSATTNLNGSISNDTGVVTTTLRHTDGGTLRLGGDGSGFTGTLNNARGNLQLVSQNWAGTDLVAQDGGVTTIVTAGDTNLKSLASDRDVVINAGARLNLTSGNYTASQGAAVNNFWMQGSGKLTSSSGTLTLDWPVSYNTAGDQSVRVIIEDFNGSTPLAVVKNGIGGVNNYDKANTYTGGTTINGGRISATNTLAFGPGAVTINSGGQAYLNVGSTFANNFTINGIGSTETAGNLGAIRFQNSTISGNLTVASSARIVGYSGAAGTISGSLLGSGDLEINSSAATFNGAITFSGNTSGYTGNLTVSQGTTNVLGSLGGGLTVGSTATATANVFGSVAGSVTVTNGTANLGSSIGGGLTVTAGTATVASTIGGSVTVNGGTATVAGSVAGDVTVNGGRANLSGNVTGNITVADGATLSGEVSAANVTLGSTLGGNLVTSATTSGALTAGTLTVNGIVTVTVSGSPASPGAFPIINFTSLGGTPPTAANFALANAASYRGATFAVNANDVTLDFGGIASTWTGSVNGNWNVNTDANFSNGSAQTFYAGDSVTFDDSSAVNTVALVGTVTPGSVTINNTATTYVFNGAGNLAGSFPLTKSGTGTATLGGTGNTYTGNISVTGGILKAGSATAFGQTSSITVASGAQVDVNGQTPGTVATGGHSFTIAGSGPDGTGAITNTGAANFGNAGVKNLTLSGNASVGGVNRFDIGAANVAGQGTINGNGFTLTKVGANQMQIRGPVTNMPIVINGGIFGAEDSDLSLGGATGSVTVNAGTLGSYGNRTIATPVSFAAGTTLQNQGGGTGTWTGALTAAGNLTVQTDGNTVLDGDLAIAGNLTRNGANTLFLQGAGTGIAGRLINNAGTLRIENGSALGLTAAADSFTFAGGSTIQGGTIASLGSVTLGGSGKNITHSGTGTVFYDAGAGLTMTVNGDIAGGVTNLSAQNGTVAFGGALTLFDPALTAAVLTARNGATFTFASGANASVRQISLGLDQQGTLANMNVAPGASVTTTRFVTSDGRNTSSTINQTGGTFTITGNNNSNSTSSSFLLGHWSGSSTYNLSGGTLNSTAAYLSLGWDTAGGVNFNQSAGTANLYGINLANGRNNAAAYNLTGGRLNLGAGGVTNNTAKAINASDATIGAFANWTSAKPLALSGTVTFDTLDSVDGLTARNINAGTLTGTGSLVKTGEGNLAVTTASGYTGSISVNGGALNAGTVGGAATLTLASGTNLTVGSGGAVSFDLNGASTVTSNDQIIVNGDLTFASGSYFRPSFSGVPTDGNYYKVMTYTGTLTGSPVIDPAYETGTRVSYQVVDSIPNEIGIEVAGTVASLVWAGNGTNNNWDVVTSQTWLNGGTPDGFYTSDSVAFDDTGDNTDPITLIGTLSPASITFDNSTKDYVFDGSGILSAGIGLTKNGTGRVTFLNTNDYALTGALVINAGTVQIGNGGTSGSIPGTGAITIESGAALEINHSSNETLTRALLGTGGTLVKNGSGTLTTSVGGNTADITVNAGSLVARGGGFSAAFAAGKLITMNPGTTLDTAVHTMGSSVGGGGDVPRVTLNGANWILNGEQYMRTLTLNAATTTKVGTLDGIRTLGGSVYTVEAAATSSTIGSPLNLVNALSLVVNDGAAADDLVISGLISNVGAVTKTGAGLVSITGTANTATGAFNINEGTVAVPAINESTVPGPLAQGAVTLNGGTLAYTGATATSGRVLALGVSGGTLEVTDAAANLTLTGAFAANSLTKSGPGTLTLNAANTHASTTILAGALVPASAAALGAGPVTVTGGSLDLNGQVLAPANAVSVGAAGTLTGAGTFTPSGAIAGTVSPGGTGTAGRIIAASGITFGSTAVLNLEIGGTAGGTFDVVEAQAEVVMAGTVNLSLINGFNPALGDSFDLVVDDGGQSGSVVLGTLPTLDAGLTWNTAAFDTTGVVSVVSTDPVAAHAASYGLTGNDALPDADPDGDGISNALEYALNISPAANNGPEYRGVASVTPAGALTLAFRRPVGGVAGVTYGVEFKTADLDVANTGWNAGVLNTDYTQNIVLNGDGTETVTFTLTGTVSGRKFARLKVNY